MAKLVLTLKCNYCAGEGWIETDNNGPIIPCPVCRPKNRREREYEAAVEQRRAALHTEDTGT